MADSGLMKILYVDDETINLDLFQMIYKDTNNVLLAENGQDGLKIVKQNADVQLIISDMHMPDMDGIYFIEKVKETNQNIPCFILSGYQRNERIIDALNSGLISYYLMKPFGKKNLEMIIEKIIHSNNQNTQKN